MDGPTGVAVLNAIVDVPLDRAADHPSLSFAPKVGFEATLAGNIRHLAVPVDAAPGGVAATEVAGRARRPPTEC